VAAFEPRTTFSTRVNVGARRQKAFLIGETSFAHQTVDAVSVTAGSARGTGAVLTDVQNASHGRGVGGTGGSVRLIAGNGKVVSLPISGEGRSLTGAQMVGQDGFVTLYATAQTVAALSGAPGYTRLAFRLHDQSLPAAHRAVTAIRQYLQTVPGFTGFTGSRAASHVLALSRWIQTMPVRALAIPDEVHTLVCEGHDVA
jgi:hypothetical protein